MAIAVWFRTGLRAALGLGILSATACKDSGLPGKNLPVAEAESKPMEYALYDGSLNVAAVRFGDHDWLAAGPTEQIQEQLLTRVGEDGGRDVFALLTDRAPYTRLYVRDDHGFVPLARAD